MVKEAEQNREADQKRKEKADTINEAEQMIFATEKAIKDLGDKIDTKDKEEAETLIKELKDALEKDDLDDIKAKKDKLTEKSMALATKVYEEEAKKNEAKQAENKETENEPKKDDDAIDASFEEKK